MKVRQRPAETVPGPPAMLSPQHAGRAAILQRGPPPPLRYPPATSTLRGFAIKERVMGIVSKIRAMKASGNLRAVDVMGKWLRLKDFQAAGKIGSMG